MQDAKPRLSTMANSTISHKSYSYLLITNSLLVSISLFFVLFFHQNDIFVKCSSNLNSNANLALKSRTPRVVAAGNLSSPIIDNNSSLPISNSNSTKPTNNATTNDFPRRLKCDPGEQRMFSYESSTQIWSGSEQQVKLRAKLRLKCLEPLSSSSSDSLRYLAQVTNLQVRSLESASSSSKQNNINRAWTNSVQVHESDLKVEPLLEEVGDVVLSLQRSVSGWFSKAWTSVKGFFSNIFTSSEKSNVGRDQALEESGFDISSQCRASGKRKSTAGLPIDESIFDMDPVEPSAVLDGKSVLDTSTRYDIVEPSTSGVSGDSEDETNDQYVSFFDDPRAGSIQREKRESNSGRHQTKTLMQFVDYEEAIRIPFVFVQSTQGLILQIQFASNDSDVSVRNFKRHLCDLFATQLPQNTTTSTVNANASTLLATNETSPIGHHWTDYVVDGSTNATRIKAELAGNKLVSGQFEKLMAETSPQILASTNQTPNKADSNLARESSDSNEEYSISVLRKVNTTKPLVTSKQTNLNSVSENREDNQEMFVGVRQVQQIADGRVIGSTGVLCMSLGSSQNECNSNKKSRSKRSSKDNANNQNLNDLSELIQLETSFSMQLIDSDKNRAARSIPGEQATRRLSAIHRPPSDPHDLRKLLNDLRNQETKLSLSTSSLKSELGRQSRESQLTERLELLRDQVQMRLNEEYLGNKLRRVRSSALLLLPQENQKMNGLDISGRRQHNTIATNKRARLESAPIKSTSGDLGLSLTQLILNSGATKHKGTVYPTLEEIIELESLIGDRSHDPNSISHLLQQTLRLDRLQSHCKSAIVTVDQIRMRATRSKPILMHPFGVGPADEQEGDNKNTSATYGSEISRAVSHVANQNHRRLEECTKILGLLLRVSERATGDLVIELIDECNDRLLAASKHEELGHGPMTKYFRSLRQKFIELLADLRKPSEKQVDKLVSRLSHYYHEFGSIPSSGHNRKAQNSIVRSHGSDQSEFVYVKPGNGQAEGERQKVQVIRDEDDFNNRDQAASLLMALTTLASQPSIGPSKRRNIIERLVLPLKSSTCSVYSSPDLDILESLSNFRSQNEPVDELVSAVYNVCKRCRHSEHYVIACIHALQGQLVHRGAQRFYAEVIRAANITCTSKREVLYSLLNSVEATRFDEQTTNLNVKTRKDNLAWPASGLNSLDDLLIELVELPPQKGSTQRARFELDRKCLRSLVGVYMSLKEIPNNIQTHKSVHPLDDIDRQTRRRMRRGFKNDDQFWDWAKCKRWNIGPDSKNINNTSGANSQPNLFETSDPFDVTNGSEQGFDSLSLLSSLADQRFKSSLSRRLESENLDSNSTTSNQNSINNSTTINAVNHIGSHPSNGPSVIANDHRRLKCIASKTVGPRNAKATIKAELINDIMGNQDENKFLARFSISSSLLGRQVPVGRMYLWHQRHTSRARVHILGKNLWDSSHSCLDKAPHHLSYMPLFETSLWLVKISVGLKLRSEMGFFTNCAKFHYDVVPGDQSVNYRQSSSFSDPNVGQNKNYADEIRLYPTVSLQASAEASARLVVARAGLSLASRYGYQGDIRVSKQPESCMSIESGHQPMNVTLSSWIQLWDSDCHFWGSRDRDQPLATRWKLEGHKPTLWLDDECLKGQENNTSARISQVSTLRPGINP